MKNRGAMSAAVLGFTMSMMCLPAGPPPIAGERTIFRGSTTGLRMVERFTRIAHAAPRAIPHFKSAVHLQRVASVHELGLNLLRVGRHLLRSAHHRLRRNRGIRAMGCGCTV